MTDQKNIDIVVLYSDADDNYWGELERHIGLLTRMHENVDIWTIKDVELGGLVTQRIRDRLRRADITLMLLSADFAADQVLDEETRLLLSCYARQKRGSRYILPIIVKDFLWHDHYDNQFDIEQLKVFKNFASEPQEREKLYKEIAQTLNEYIQDINTRPIHFSIPTWVGYIGGIKYNHGFIKNQDISLYKNYKRTLRFNINDDKEDLCQAWLRGDTQILPSTIDRLPYFINQLRDYHPKVIYQASWSDGADAILARNGIRTIEELKGKKILYPLNTPAHTFLKYVLTEAEVDFFDVAHLPQKTSDLDELTKKFLKDESIDAVVLWSPYLEACQEEIPEATVITDTGDYPNLIADVVLVGQEFLQLNHDELVEIFLGWSREIEQFDQDAVYQAGAISTLIDAIIRPLPSIIPTRIRESLTGALRNYFTQSLQKVHLCTLRDNFEFFGMEQAGNAPTLGEEIYHKFLKMQYEEFQNELDFQWSQIVDTSLIETIAEVQRKEIQGDRSPFAG